MGGQLFPRALRQTPEVIPLLKSLKSHLSTLGGVSAAQRSKGPWDEWSRLEPSGRSSRLRQQRAVAWLRCDGTSLRPHASAGTPLL